MIKNQSWRSIPNWFNYQDYYEHIVQILPNDAVIVELGTWLGASLCYLIHAAEEYNKHFQIFAVDSWRGSAGDEIHTNIISAMGGIDALYQKFNEYMVETCCANKFTPLKMTTVEAAKHFDDESVHFAYVDAGHLYHEVKLDLEIWWPKIKKGFYIGGHDYAYEEPTSVNGVIRAVNEFKEKEKDNIREFITYPEQRVWHVKKR